MKIRITQGNKLTVIEVTTAMPIKIEEPDKGFLQWLFRQLNRVDGDEMISVLQLDIPSLSVGDLVEFDGRTFRCEFVGWREVL